MPSVRVLFSHISGIFDEKQHKRRTRHRLQVLLCFIIRYSHLWISHTIFKMKSLAIALVVLAAAAHVQAYPAVDLKSVAFLRNPAALNTKWFPQVRSRWCWRSAFESPMM